MFQYGYLMISFGITIIVTFSIDTVSARFCEGGHRCSPPKECCAQGCCYLYAPPQSVPRTPPQNNTSHVLNLFFINHWFFWCIIFAIIIAILCACSLWRKRRQICGWGSQRPHSQSGDSAGSCYAPPQYSRCSSFHHAPPPYTEVTSKPDLYPLVFTCNADNGKSGASYLMVQYFRNYIVRPVGSLSATSTVDSLSSSFICNANEANTLVPPSYSRAGSPMENSRNRFDLPINIQDYSSMPRSASQHVYSDQLQQNQQPTYRPIPVLMTNNDEQITLYRHRQLNDNDIDDADGGFGQFRRTSHSVSFQRLHSNSTNDIVDSTINNSSNSIFSSPNINKMNGNSDDNNASRLLSNMSQSDQQFRYIIDKCNNSNLSIPNNCDVITNAQRQHDELNQHQQQHMINMTIAHECSTNTKNNNKKNINNSNSTSGIYDSCASIVDDNNAMAMPMNSSTIMLNTPTENPNRDFKDLNAMCRSFDSCGGQMNDLQQSLDSSGCDESATNAEILKKYATMRGFMCNSVASSAVSSLANIDSPASPPQATSPTGEIQELLEQIRQLQQNASSRDDFNLHGNQSGTATTFSNQSSSSAGDVYDGDQESSSTNGMITTQTKKRPSTLHAQNRRQANRTRFFPISAAAKNLRSPIGSGASLLGFGRGRKGWISKSAPSTPGTQVPSCYLNDDSPLLDEHDEDAEHNT